jgi:RecJ-like exonuclease
VQTKLDYSEEERPAGKLALFSACCDEVGRFCSALRKPLVVHHYDADGLSSGAVVVGALKKLGREPVALMQKQLVEESLEHIRNAAKKLDCDGVVFVDFGSGYYSLIEKILGEEKIAVIDHHEPEKATRRKGFAEANPHFFGVDGGSEASASTTAFLCFKQYAFNELAELAIVGAVGDMQDAGGLKGANLEVAREAERNGYCETTKDLRLFGRVSRPLANFLAFCDEPFIPGLAGNERAAAKFLLDNGIPLYREEGGKRVWLHYYDLSLEQRRKLASAVINHCLAHGVSKEIVAEMIGEVYSLPRRPRNTELYDAYEFATLLNACGRHGHPEQGIAVCLGEESAYEKARELLALHRALIRKGIALARKKAVDFGVFYFVDGRKEISDLVIGTVANALRASALFPEDKPFIALSLSEEGKLKFSARASKALVEKGLNLNKVMSEAAKGLGVGGGHAAAAGANIEPGSEGEFLKRCAKAIEAQIA